MQKFKYRRPALSIYELVWLNTGTHVIKMLFISKIGKITIIMTLTLIYLLQFKVTLNLWLSN